MADDEGTEQIELTEGEIINDKYAIVRMIARGGFGIVYHVVSLVEDFQGAMKVEPLQAEAHVLRMEVEVLHAFREHSPDHFIKAVDHGFTTYDDRNNFSFIVMPLCGPDLTRLHFLVGPTLSEGTTLRIALKSLITIKEIHEVGYIHRDIKPCNFATSAYGGRDVHLIDFGMARQYAVKYGSRWELRRPRNRVHFRGTHQYCSLNAHKRTVDQSRVDDLWSWFYMCIELRKQLPWTRMRHPEQICYCKEQYTEEKLCGLDPVLAPFVHIAGHLKKLVFHDRPDYRFIVETLERRIREIKCQLIDPYDWDGKLVNQDDVQEMVTRVCEANNIKRTTKSEKNRTEEEEWEEIRKTIKSTPKDVPGGKEYVSKRKKSEKRLGRSGSRLAIPGSELNQQDRDRTCSEFTESNKTSKESGAKAGSEIMPRDQTLLEMAKRKEKAKTPSRSPKE